VWLREGLVVIVGLGMLLSAWAGCGGSVDVNANGNSGAPDVLRSRHRWNDGRVLLLLGGAG
jgi:hypothetical protein